MSEENLFIVNLKKFNEDTQQNDALLPKTLADAVIETDEKQFITKRLKDAISAKQESLGYTPVNKTGDSMSGALIINTEVKDAKQAVTKEYVDNKISELVNGSTAALDTIYELAKAIGNDPDFSISTANLMGKKLNKDEAVSVAAPNKLLYLDVNSELQANVKSATKASQDADGNDIKNTYARKDSLKTVATSGSYNDLTDKPNIKNIDVATNTTLGGIKVGDNLSITADGVLSANPPGNNYVLPAATVNTLGGIKVGTNLTIDANGVLNAAASGGSSDETLQNLFGQLLNEDTQHTYTLDEIIGTPYKEQVYPDADQLKKSIADFNTAMNTVSEKVDTSVAEAKTIKNQCNDVYTSLDNRVQNFITATKGFENNITIDNTFLQDLIGAVYKDPVYPDKDQLDTAITNFTNTMNSISSAVSDKVTAVQTSEAQCKTYYNYMIEQWGNLDGTSYAKVSALADYLPKAKMVSVSKLPDTPDADTWYFIQAQS